MKKSFAFILVATTFLFILFEVAQSANKAVQTETISVRHDMIYVLQEPCAGNGDKCTELITIVIVNPFTISTVTGGRMIDIPISGTINEFTPDEIQYPPYTNHTDGKVVTFPYGSTLRISECDSDPSLIGLNLNVSSLTTDNNGILHYFLPF